VCVRVGERESTHERNSESKNEGGSESERASEREGERACVRVRVCVCVCDAQHFVDCTSLGTVDKALLIKVQL